MPRLHEQVGVLAVTDHSPSCRENFRDLIGAKEHIGSVAGHAIDGRSQRIERAELVHDVARRRVDGDRLRGGEGPESRAAARACLSNTDGQTFHEGSLD